MKVNELSKKTGVAPHVIRYYSRIGLLRPRRDSNNGYKLYNGEDVRRLEFIRRTQSIGFTLTEISKLMEQYKQEECNCCEQMYHMLQEHIEQNRRKIDELMQLQQRMETALAEWDAKGPSSCAGNPACPVVSLGKCTHSN